MVPESDKKLLIDIGNTSAKLAVASDGDFLHFERRTEPWPVVLARLSQQFGGFESVRLSSVAGEDAQLDAALESLGVPVLRLTNKVPCPVKPVPNVPPTLGADRWAADIGALSLDSEHTLLIVDAGTCITYDVLSRKGEILGGAISPGVQLRLNAMHEHTALLPQLAAEGEADLLGHDTHGAMLSAAVNGARFEVEGYIRCLQADFPDLHVFITGGNTFEFSPDITCPVTRDPHLVFRGLAAIR